MTNLLNMNSISQLKLWLCHVKLCKDVHRIKIDFIWSHFCLLSRVNDNHTDNAIEASWQRLLMLMRLDFNAFCLKEKRNISALNCFSYQIQGSLFVNNHENMKPYSYIKINNLSIFLNWHDFIRLFGPRQNGCSQTLLPRCVFCKLRKSNRVQLKQIN